jgi:hypothetical protein
MGPVVLVFLSMVWAGSSLDQPVNRSCTASSAQLHLDKYALDYPEMDKFLHVTPRYGLGNKILSVVSAYALAFITDRALIVDWGQEKEFFDPLFQPPFDWDADKFLATHRAGMSLQNALILPMTGLSDQLIASSTMLACDDLNAIDDSKTFLLIDADQYFLPLLALNEHHGTRIREVFGADPFSSIVRWLFRPAPAIAEQVRAEPAQHPGTAAWATHASTMRAAPPWLHLPNRCHSPLCTGVQHTVGTTDPLLHLSVFLLVRVGFHVFGWLVQPATGFRSKPSTPSTWRGGAC